MFFFLGRMVRFCVPLLLKAPVLLLIGEIFLSTFLYLSFFFFFSLSFFPFESGVATMAFFI